MRLLFFLFSIASLHATINEPFTISIGAGYRQDHLKARLQEPGGAPNATYQEKYDHLRFLETDVTLRTIYRDIFFYANGAYGALGYGGGTQSKIPLSFSVEEPEFFFDTDAFTGDVMGIMGYAANLTPGRHYQVALIPFFGYAYYYEKIRRKDPTSYQGSTNNGSPEIFTMTSTLGDDTTTIWDGFFIGGGIQAKPAYHTTFDVMYAYHFMGFRQTLKSQFRTKIFSDGINVSSETLEKNCSKVSSSGNHGHLGLLKMSWCVNSLLSLSLQGKIWYFTTHVRDVMNERTTLTVVPAGTQTITNQNRKYKYQQLTFNFLFFVDFKL